MIIVYAEGFYVDHRYYETRYEDTVMGTGNTAGSDARYRGFEFLRMRFLFQCY